VIDELLPGVDHLVLAAPATPKTAHLIGADELSAVKPGVHLVNIARGALVDQDALRVALDDGRPGRALLTYFGR
jgi:phosphoglycerate dehydrogenase-like enzyme